jgi:hypothetical protein
MSLNKILPSRCLATADRLFNLWDCKQHPFLYICSCGIGSVGIKIYILNWGNRTVCVYTEGVQPGCRGRLFKRLYIHTCTLAHVIRVRRDSAGVHACLASISYFLEMGCVETGALPFIKPYVYMQRGGHVYKQIVWIVWKKTEVLSSHNFYSATTHKYPLRRKNPPQFWHELAALSPFKVRIWGLVKQTRDAVI